MPLSPHSGLDMLCFPVSCHTHAYAACSSLRQIPNSEVPYALSCCDSCISYVAAYVSENLRARRILNNPSCKGEEEEKAHEDAPTPAELIEVSMEQELFT